jgi:hypothetical protein
MEEMTVGMCLDYVGVYYDFKNPDKKEENTRTATQSDYDSF